MGLTYSHFKRHMAFISRKNLKTIETPKIPFIDQTHQTIQYKIQTVKFIFLVTIKLLIKII